MKRINPALVVPLVLAVALVPASLPAQYCLENVWTEQISFPDVDVHVVDIKRAFDGGVIALLDLRDAAGGRVLVARIGSSSGVEWSAFAVADVNHHAAGILLAADSANGAFAVTVDTVDNVPTWALHRIAPPNLRWTRPLDMTAPAAMDCDALNRVGVWGMWHGQKFGLMFDGTGTQVGGASVTAEPLEGTTHTAALPTGEIAVASTLALYGHSDLQCNMYTLSGGQNWDVMVDGTGSNDVAYTHDVCLDASGDVYLLSRLQAGGTSRAELVSLNRADGSQRWARSIVSSGSLTPEAMTYADGDIVVAAGRRGMHDVLVRYYSTSGDSLGEASVSAGDEDAISPVYLEPMHDGAVAAVLQTNRAGYPQMRVLRADVSGALCAAETHAHSCVPRAVCSAGSDLTVVGNDVADGSVEIVALRSVSNAAPALTGVRDRVGDCVGRDFTADFRAGTIDPASIRVFDVHGRAREVTVKMSRSGSIDAVTIDGGRMQVGVYLVVLGDATVRWMKAHE